MKTVRDMKPSRIQLPAGGLTKLGRLAVVVACLAVALAGGCQKKDGGASGEGIVPSDPQLAANLADLSRELRRAMPSHHLSGSFEEFVAVSHLDVPPPPPGQKYAISKRWKVIVVDAK
jgi:hypothetical protein